MRKKRRRGPALIELEEALIVLEEVKGQGLYSSQAALETIG